MKLFDTHCHINDSKAFPDPAVPIENARNAGVEKIIVVGLDPENWRSAIAIAERFADVYAIIGWHPNYTNEYDGLSDLRQQLSHPKVVALGEIGLDYHWDYSPPDVQRRALHEQLDLAEELNLPVVFHCREAHADLFGILEDRPVRPYLIHCFGGNSEDAARAAALGCHFGVDGPVTYKKSDALRETLSQIPLDRLVLETDSPYMTPEPLRGKPNEPANVALVNVGLAFALQISREECAELTTENAVRFFGLDR